MFKPEIGKEYTLQEGEDSAINHFTPGSKVEVLARLDRAYYWCRGTSRTHGGQIEQIIHVSCLRVEQDKEGSHG